MLCLYASRILAIHLKKMAPWRPLHETVPLRKVLVRSKNNSYRRSHTSKIYNGQFEGQSDTVKDSVAPQASRSFQLLHPGNLGYRHDLSEGILDSLSDLHGSTYENFPERAAALGAWKAKLRKGILPKLGKESWPVVPLQQELLAALSRMEMPGFCRQYPALLDALLRQLLEVVNAFEAQMPPEEDQPQPEASQNSPSDSSSSQQQEEDESPDQAEQDCANGEPGDPSNDAEKASKGGQTSGNGTGQKLESSMQEVLASGQQTKDKQAMMEQRMQEAVAKAAKEVVEKFEKNWEPMMDSVKESVETFGSIEGLLEGNRGFDSSRALWKDAGWREIRDIRKMLENLKEITALVRSLGRSSGKGALKRAPQQVFAGKGALGLHRSPLQPEETVSLTRSGDISLMLPSEAHLLASSSSAAKRSDGEGWSPMRRLHMARRAEKTLLSYERSGWMEDSTTVTKHMEIRPSSEMGPIICCLDTSGSMYGARETVAKAVTLECMRGAFRQKRQCFLYAFGGPGDVMELELSLKPGVMEKLLAFLRFSFGGGTDVDRPLELSLSRLELNEWKQADILMVTDGEIPPPSQEVQDRLKAAHDSMGLEVHGLLVGSDLSPAMEMFATHLHIFKAWDAVKARV